MTGITDEEHKWMREQGEKDEKDITKKDLLKFIVLQAKVLEGLLELLNSGE